MQESNDARALLGGRYRLLERIGAGAMATVHRARDEFLGRDVAIKLVQTRASTLDEVRRDDAEAKLLARLNHHSLVALLDAGTDLRDPGRPRVYLVMELINGPDLRVRLAEGPMRPRQVAQIGFDLAEGLDYIHSCGVVHRDVKPANVMMVNFRTDGTRVRAKLTDFGVALMTEEPLTREGVVTGTAAYLSPEQVKGESVGPFSDIYALGLVLLQCLTGVVAYPGPLVESAVARLVRNPDIPESLGPDWCRLLTAMTATDPAERPLAQEIVSVLYGLAMEPGPDPRAGTAVMPADEEGRLEAVRRYGILDTPPDGAFDRITGLAARLFDVPVAIVSVVDHDRIWFKSHHGLDIEQIDRDPGLCASAILSDGAWVVGNAPEDPRTLTNPLVAGEFGLKFYAGVPLRTHDGFNLGTLCVLDFAPREVDAGQVKILEDLAAVVMDHLELMLESRQSAAVA